MTSLVHGTAMVLILIVCGSALYQVSAASSCPLLDIATLLSGNYYVVDGGIRVNITFIPVDNPALNQYKPFYYLRTSNDEIYLEGTFLLAEGSGSTYTIYFYFIDNLSQYGSPESYLSTITRDDLPAYPNCTENGVVNEDKMQSTVYCYLKGIYVSGECERTCSYWSIITTVLGLPPSEAEKSEFERLPVYNNKTQEYPLPASWLEGHEDYVSLCSA